MTYTITLTPVERATGVTLAAIAEQLPRALVTDRGTRVVVPDNLSPALAGCVARAALGGAVRFTGLNTLGYPVYRLEHVHTGFEAGAL